MRRLPGLALAGVLATSSCGAARCTTIGTESRVLVDVANPRDLIDFCIDDHCLSAGSGLSGLGAGILVADKPATYRYRVLTRTGTGETRTIEGTVTTEPYEVNGRGCGTTSSATVEVGFDGEIAITHP